MIEVFAKKKSTRMKKREREVETNRGTGRQREPHSVIRSIGDVIPTQPSQQLWTEPSTTLGSFTPAGAHSRHYLFQMSSVASFRLRCGAASHFYLYRTNSNFPSRELTHTDTYFLSLSLSRLLSLTTTRVLVYLCFSFSSSYTTDQPSLVLLSVLRYVALCLSLFMSLCLSLYLGLSLFVYVFISFSVSLSDPICPLSLYPSPLAPPWVFSFPATVASSSSLPSSSSASSSYLENRAKSPQLSHALNGKRE